jgi:hypothetical protein
MRGQPVCERLRVARTNIRLASQSCTAPDLASLQRAIHLLETAADAMRQVEREVRSAAPPDSSALWREAAMLKREVAGMMRVIDGCAALWRGLSVRLGCTALTYTPRGHAIAASPSAAACEMQG